MASGFLGAIKGVLFESEGEPPATVADVNQPVVAVNAPPVLVNDIGGTEEMEGTVRRLSELATAKPTAYTRLQQAASRLESFIPDEAARYKGAISVGGDFDAAAVIQAIDHDHLGALDQQISAFTAQTADQMKQEVDRRMQAIESTRSQVQARAVEAERLRQALATSLSEMARLDASDNQMIAETLAEADAKRHEIERVERRFHLAAEKVRGNLQQMREKLIRYLAA
ncbi:hypothetical protein ACWA7J_09135 [Leptothrix sp. BB-4]